MTDQSRYFNTTDSSVTVDGEGRAVDGLTWTDKIERTEQVEAALALGSLIEEPAQTNLTPDPEKGDTSSTSDTNQSEEETLPPEPVPSGRPTSKKKEK